MASHPEERYPTYERYHVPRVSLTIADTMCMLMRVEQLSKSCSSTLQVLRRQRSWHLPAEIGSQAWSLGSPGIAQFVSVISV